MTKKISTIEYNDGQVARIEHPEEWDQDKVLAWARLNREQTKTTGAASGTDNKEDDPGVLDLLSLGASRLAVQFIPDVFLVSREERQAEIERALNGQRTENAGVFQERAARRMAGIPENAELSLGQEVLAGFGDPTTFAAGPGRAGQKAIDTLAKQAVGAFSGPLQPVARQTATELVKRTAAVAPSAAIASSAGTVTGLAAPDVVGQLGGGELAQEITGAVTGGIVGAGAGAVAGRATTSTALRLGKDVKRRLTGEKSDLLGPASEAMANSQIRAEINRIKTTTSPSEVAKAVNNLAELKQEIPNLEIGGIVATLSENSVARDWIRKTSTNNKAFQKDITDVLKRDAEKLADRFDVLLENQEKVSRVQIEDVVRTEFDKKQTQLETRFDKQQENIDKALANLTERLTGRKDEFEIGQTAQRLRDRKETEVRKAADELYSVTNVIGKRISLTDDQIMNVWKEFQNVRLADFFGPDSRVRSKLESAWKPKEVEGEDGGITLEFPSVSGTDLVSLKKAVNTEITKLSKAGQTPENLQRLNRLYETKSIVRNMLDDLRSTDPKFVDSLDKADAFYYKELGLPMRAEGMKDFSAKRFSQGAAQTLMNYEKAIDYVNFVGKQGEAVVRHAIRLKAEQSNVISPDGTINQGALDKFVRRNRRLIERFGLENEFNDISGRLRTIRNTARRHNAAYKEKASELSTGFFKSVFNKNLNAVVNEIKSNPGKRKQYLNEIDKLNKTNKDIVLSGLRQEFLNQAVTVSGSMKEYVNTHKETASDLFGAGYVKNINKLAGVKDLMEQVSATMLDTLGGNPVMDTARDLTGVSLSEYAGTFRNQILSMERKAINLVTKAAVTKGRDKFYVKSAEVLLDPDVVEKLANPPKEGMKEYLSEYKKGTQDYLKQVGTFYLDALQDSISLSTYKALTGATQAMQSQQLEQETQQ